MKNSYLIYGFLALLVYSYYKRKKSKVNVYYLDNLPLNYNGLIVPPIGIFINKSKRDSEELLNHELIHWEQYKTEGLKMIPKYIVESIRNGYDRNKYEIKAREGESEFCKTNYTHCVRNGLAKTSHNKNFRK